MTSPLSSTPDQRPSTPTRNPPRVSAHPTPIHSTPIKQRGMGSPIAQLPELDVSRPITWGPLAFGQTPQQSPEKIRMNSLDHVDEDSESEWEKEHDDEETVEEPKVDTLPGSYPEDLGAAEEAKDEVKKLDEEDVGTVDRESYKSPAARTSAVPDTVVEEKKEEATISGNAPDVNASSEEDEPISRLDKGKERETYPDSSPVSPVTPRPLSQGTSIYPDAIPRSKYIDRDITSFFATNVNLPRDSPRSEAPTPKSKLPPLQTQPVPSPPSLTILPLDHLPSFMSAHDIPQLSTVAQRVGAYQNRRDQLMKADSGLRGWLLQIQHGRPPSFPRRIYPIVMS